MKNIALKRKPSLPPGSGKLFCDRIAGRIAGRKTDGYGPIWLLYNKRAAWRKQIFGGFRFWSHEERKKGRKECIWCDMPPSGSFYTVTQYVEKKKQVCCPWNTTFFFRPFVLFVLYICRLSQIFAYLLLKSYN